MKFKLLIISWLCLSVTGLFFCSSSKKSSNSTGKIAVVIPTQKNPWFVVLGEAAKTHAEELGYEAVIFDSQNSISRETEHFNNIIASGFKAILLDPVDAKGSVANVKAANQVEIPVFLMDRELDTKYLAASQILSDNFSGCVILGHYFAGKLNGKGNYVELLGLESDKNTWNRSRGFHSVVDKYPDLKMLAQQSGEFDRDKAMEVMGSMLQTYPNIDAVFCGNDAMAMGAYQAALEAGKTDKIMIFGFDGAAEVVDAIRDGKIVATCMQFPKTIAETAAEYADKYIKGDRYFNKQVPVSVELVTKYNVDNFTASGEAN